MKDKTKEILAEFFNIKTATDSKKFLDDLCFVVVMELSTTILPYISLEILGKLTKDEELDLLRLIILIYKERVEELCKNICFINSAAKGFFDAEYKKIVFMNRIEEFSNLADQQCRDLRMVLKIQKNIVEVEKHISDIFYGDKNGGGEHGCGK